MTNQINFHGDIRSVDEGFHQTAIPDPILIRFEFLIFLDRMSSGTLNRLGQRGLTIGS